MKKNISTIFLANFFTLLSGVITSLLTAWALGPEGRGELAVIVLYPNVVALAVGMGLPQAHRYWLAREPESISPLFSNALLFAGLTGVVAYGAALFVVPSLIGVRSEAVIWLVKFYLINIPFALLYDLMAGILEGSRQFKWAALARIIFFGIQSAAYFLLWMTDTLNIYTAALTMVVAQLANTCTAFLCVYYVLRPSWQPSWTIWKKSIAFGLKYHVGVVTSFTTLRFDQLLLGAMATSIELGLYVIAVRLSEITTVLASSVAEVLMPEVAASKENEHSVQLLTRSLRQMTYVYLLILFPLLMGAPLVLKFAFGAEFLPPPAHSTAARGFDDVESRRDYQQRVKWFRLSRFKHRFPPLVGDRHGCRAALLASALWNRRRGAFFPARLQRDGRRRSHFG